MNVVYFKDRNVLLEKETITGERLVFFSRPQKKERNPITSTASFSFRRRYTYTEWHIETPS